MKHSYFSRRLLSVFMAFALGLSVLLAKDFVVVIDAGHGGHDPGSLGSKAKEKNINLGVALKLGRLIENNMQGVKVVYTRKKDVYLTLQERANIANKVQGDLFISIHTNSLDKKSPNRRKVAGASTWILGLHRSKENLEVAKRENSVIYLENDFSTRYEGFDPNSTESYIIFEFMQYKHMEQSINFASDIQREFVSTAGRVDRGVRQAGFWVLAKTSMPAVLVELDFICNPTQERFLNSESGQEKMAKSIYNAFVKYTSDYDRKQNAGKRVEESPSSSAVVSPDKKTQTGDSNVEVSEQAEKSGVTYYKVQFMALPRKLPANSKEFKGLSPVEYYKDGGMYKYTYGKSTDRDEIQKQYKKVKSLFRDAFIIKFRDGKRVY
ncbi:MAG: N-acetylmuramoyl-L-alanine amidase family protein [Barnesiella intestinihominis]